MLPATPATIQLARFYQEAERSRRLRAESCEFGGGPSTRRCSSNPHRAQKRRRLGILSPPQKPSPPASSRRVARQPCHREHSSLGGASSRIGPCWRASRSRAATLPRSVHWALATEWRRSVASA